ncbi:MAG: hypothetical protein KJN92_11975, partial [Gemmatimonadetes bacterium]|nr:hypothetical protein [Gemmatimonadota bacterium]
MLLTCVHKRPELTRAVLGIYRQMQRSVAEEVDLRLLAVGSEGLRSRKMCEDHGFDYIEHANSPLSHKWNAGVDAARDYDPDGLVIVGSDDLVSKEMFRAYADRLSDGVDFFGLEDLYFFDAATGLLGYWSGYGSLYPARKGEPIGCGRCFSRRLLDSTFWNLWPMGQGFESGL